MELLFNWSMMTKTAKISVFSVIYSFVLLLSFTQTAKANMCVDLFMEVPTKEMVEARKFDRMLSEIEDRIGMYSQLSGLAIKRKIIESESYARKIKYEIKAGLVKQVIARLENLFKRYEVNVRMAQTIENEIEIVSNQLKAETNILKKAIIWKKIRTLRAEKEGYELAVGRKHYDYIALKEMLVGLANSKTEKQAWAAKEILGELEFITTNHGSKFGFKFKKLTIDKANAFVEKNLKANEGLLRRAAWEEAWLALKLVTLSGPLVKKFKELVYKLPNGGWREAISDFLQINYRQHVRDSYLDDIEIIIEVDSPIERYEMMMSRNVSSERKDELLVVFARVVENMHIWEEFKATAERESTKSARKMDFYTRVLEAEKQALKDGDFPLYYEEPGATTLTKLALGAWGSAVALNKYLEAHPETTDAFFRNIESVVETLKSVAM